MHISKNMQISEKLVIGLPDQIWSASNKVFFITYGKTSDKGTHNVCYYGDLATILGQVFCT